jgi:hypothetical protein
VAERVGPTPAQRGEERSEGGLGGGGGGGAITIAASEPEDHDAAHPLFISRHPRSDEFSVVVVTGVLFGTLPLMIERWRRAREKGRGEGEERRRWRGRARA